MKREDIIKLAREAGFTEGDLAVFPDLIVHFATLVAAAERDQILEMFNKEGLWDAEGIVYAIRAREKT